jgi:hypothetical protein
MLSFFQYKFFLFLISWAFQSILNMIDMKCIGWVWWGLSLIFTRTIIVLLYQNEILLKWDILVYTRHVRNSYFEFVNLTVKAIIWLEHDQSFQLPVQKVLLLELILCNFYNVSPAQRNSRFGAISVILWKQYSGRNTGSMFQRFPMLSCRIRWLSRRVLGDPVVGIIDLGVCVCNSVRLWNSGNQFQFRLIPFEPNSGITVIGWIRGQLELQELNRIPE